MCFYAMKQCKLLDALIPPPITPSLLLPSLSLVQCSGSFSITSGDYQATYVVLGDNVMFSVSARTSGWVGIGVSNDGMMVGQSSCIV